MTNDLLYSILFFLIGSLFFYVFLSITSFSLNDIFENLKPYLPIISIFITIFFSGLGILFFYDWIDER